MAAALVAALAFLVFYLSPVQRIGDANFTVLLSEQLLTRRTFVLDEHFWPNAPVQPYPDMKPGAHWPRQVQPGGVRRAEASGAGAGPLFYIYPHGTSILALPFVALARALGLSAIGASGGHDAAGEWRVQRVVASLLCGLACGVFYLTARLLLGSRASLVAALGAGFGTQVWSTASRSLQAHTCVVLLFGLVAYRLLGALEGRRRLGPVWLATLLAWSFFVRPTTVFTIVPLTLLVASMGRREFALLVATGAAWGAAFLVYSRSTFGTWLPDYYTRGSGFESTDWSEGLLGQLLSPSRGLLVSVPLVLVVGYWLVAYRRTLRHRRLALALGAAIALHTAVMGSFKNWWGGHCYGPRFSTDLVPLFVLLGCLAARALLDRRRQLAQAGARSRVRGRLETLAFTLALLVGMLLNGGGALSYGGDQWNLVPVPIGQQPERCFDWSRPQWWCAWFPAALPPADPGSRYDVDPGG